MKTKALLTILMFVLSVSCFGKHEYTMSKTDFISQFTDPNKKNRIYCFNEKGEKVWLGYNKNSQLTLIMKEEKKKLVLLHTVKYEYEYKMIKAEEYNVWAPTNKLSSFNLEDVQSFIIVGKFQEDEYPYFNCDSSQNLVAFKNDSLKKLYSEGTEFVINLIAKGKSGMDTLSIITNACYHLNFKDDKQTLFGVVKKITKDSIYISNSFNKAMAIADKEEFTVFAYLISDISGLRLAKSGGYGLRNVNIEDYEVSVRQVDKLVLCCPYWYASSSRNGKIHFYRSYLTERGFSGITEIDGRAIWYEGG